LLQQLYSYGCINANEKASVNNKWMGPCDCKLPEAIVTCD